MRSKKLIKILNRLSKSREQIFWEKQIKVEERFEKKFKKELVTIFNKQRKKVLAKLERKSIKVDIPRVLLDVSKESKEFLIVFPPILREIIKEEGGLAFQQIGMDGEIDLENLRVTGFLKSNTIKFSTEVNKYTNKRIRTVLAAGIAEGESIPKLVKRINGVFDNCTKSRAFAIARTESSRAMNFATEEAYIESGVVEGKRWLTAFDERTCLECSSLDGKLVDLGDNFFDKGDEFLGLKLDYEDVGHPPLHSRCRCTLVPELIE